MRIILLPDQYNGHASGAIVAQVLAKLLCDMGHQVDVYSREIESDTEISDGLALHGIDAVSARNMFNRKKWSSFLHVIYNNIQPDAIFTVGSIVNKPLYFILGAKMKGLKVYNFIFMQDFFCAKIYANNEKGPCTLCLEKGFMQSFKHKCVRGWLVSLYRIYIRKLVRNVLSDSDGVITSSNEQMGFYKMFGISSNLIFKLNLPFMSDKLLELKPVLGNYYIGIAQNRMEKGFHLLAPILENLRSRRVLLAYDTQAAAKCAITNCGFQKYIDSGVLVVKDNLTWSCGLGEAIASSRGVIIPSIWPTTTEYGLLEALGLGKPVFTFDVGVHHELIQHGVNGFKFPLNGFREFANTLNELTLDDYERISMGAKRLYGRLTSSDVWREQLTKLFS